MKASARYFGTRRPRSRIVLDPPPISLAGEGWRAINAPLISLALTVVSLLILNFQSLWLPHFLTGVGTASMFCVLLVAYLLPPSIPLRETSALFARLDWLIRFLLGGAILFAGTFLGAVAGIGVDATKPESLGQLASGLVNIAMQTVVPAACFLFVVLLAADLQRAGSLGRARVLARGWNVPMLPPVVVTVASRVGASLSAPPLAAALIVGYWATSVALAD